MQAHKDKVHIELWQGYIYYMLTQEVGGIYVNIVGPWNMHIAISVLRTALFTTTLSPALTSHNQGLAHSVTLEVLSQVLQATVKHNAIIVMRMLVGL